MNACAEVKKSIAIHLEIEGEGQIKVPHIPVLSPPMIKCLPMSMTTDGF